LLPEKAIENRDRNHNRICFTRYLIIPVEPYKLLRKVPDVSLNRSLITRQIVK
jgi:hypothetical protein